MDNFNVRLYLFNPSLPSAPFLYPIKTENLRVLRCFHGVEKGCIGEKWVKVGDLFSSCVLTYLPYIESMCINMRLFNFKNGFSYLREKIKVFLIQSLFRRLNNFALFYLINDNFQEYIRYLLKILQCVILFYRLLHPVAGIADKFVVYISLRHGKLLWISLNVIPSNIITTIIIVKWF